MCLPTFQYRLTISLIRERRLHSPACCGAAARRAAEGARARGAGCWGYAGPPQSAAQLGTAERCDAVITKKGLVEAGKPAGASLCPAPLCYLSVLPSHQGLAGPGPEGALWSLPTNTLGPKAVLGNCVSTLLLPLDLSQP